MNILHIANISLNKADGVNVVVPQHVLAEAKLERVYFYNIKGLEIPDIKDMQLFHEVDDGLVSYLVKSIGKIDLVVFHEVNYPKYITIYKQLLKANIPYIIVPHGELRSGALKKKWLKKKIAYMLLFNSYIRHASAIQCLSQAEMDDIKIKTPQRFVAGNGVNMPKINKATFSKDEIKMVFIGRIEVHVKGLDLLFEAMDKERSLLSSNGVHLDIYGPDIKGRGDEVRELISEKGLDDFVRLHGPIFGEDKERAYLDSDIFVQTSRHEGLPVGILEAMSYGLPTLVTRGTSLGEMIESSNAGYVADTDAISIEKALVKAIADKDNFYAKGRCGIKAIEDNYLWDSIAKMEITAYKRFIK